LLKAQIDKGYTQKEKYLSLLTSTKDKEKSSIVSDGWLLRGHNEKEEAYYGNRQDTRKHLELALSYYKKAYDLFNKTSTNKTHEALTCWAQTAKDLGEIHQMEQVYKVIEENILSRRPSFKTYYTRSLIGTHLYEMSGDHRYLSEGIDDLKQGLLINPSDKETIQASLLLGKIHFLKNNFDQAESVLAPLVDMFPDSPLAFETLYWAGRAAERQIKPNHSPGEYYRRCFNDYPSSSFAAEAFFRVYTYQDYLNSEKEAKKHLEELLTRYPDSRFVMDTNFLLALDSKRDRKTSKGKWISKSNVTKAIDQFHQVTTDYQRFQSLNLIDDKDLAHYSSLELRATLEKALCNLTIARQSSGAKKHIYLQYAKEVFTDLIDKMGPPQPNNFKHDTFEEAVYGLAQTELEAEQYDEAEQLIHKLIDTYEASKVTRGYYLSRSWHDLSLIALADETSERSYQQSLDYLQNAEECAKGRVLSTDETIDLWLKMSHCYKMLGQYDQAMRYLTKAIDEDAVSNLRLKAMYLRAEIYQLQGRLELSRKQLEATAKKGGEWGQKAKDKLGEIYEYH
ncbi:MAG: tetratricopeptide repeat protein, partial [Chlamydiota bacterium]